MMPFPRAVLPLLCAALAATSIACDEDPVGPEPPAGFSQIAVGYEHSCATRADVTYCWGQAGKNRLGYRSDREPCHADGLICPRPIPMWGETGFEDLTLGEAHGCGVRDSSAYCWGYNQYGQLGDAGEVLTRCYGENPLPCSLEPFPVALGLPIVDIDAGPSTTCAVTSNGDAYCWGLNQFGQLGAGHRERSGIPLLVIRPEGESFATIAAALSHTCALMESGSVYCWGANPDGELGNGTRDDSLVPVRVLGDIEFAQIDAAYAHVCAVDVDGVVYCWGFYGEGRLASETSTRSRLEPFRVSIPEPIKQVSTGARHTCAVSEDGSLYCWGYNASGQLGRGAGPDSFYALETEFPGLVEEVAAGLAHTCAIRRSFGHDAIFCWGANDSGQLGVGDQVSTAFPIRVADPAPRLD